MKLGLAIADFTVPGGPGAIAGTLREVAATAEDAGFTRIAVMDHLWQVPTVSRVEREMLEAYTTLGYLAAATERVELLTLVTSATYREPGLLAKMVTTLDVLSGGRAWLGIGTGADFNAGEAHGLGLPLPPTAERFERLEEAVQICLQMWSSEDAPYAGKHYRLERTLNSPPALRRPHPPILIGGSGPKKTLRLVAEYADACNLFAAPDLPQKLAALRARCAEVGRDYDAIEKTVLYPLDPGENGSRVNALISQLHRFAELGIDSVYGPVPHTDRLTPLRLIGRHVIPEVAEF
jgi:F420-dependent oxidoreductase-like protein